MTLGWQIGYIRVGPYLGPFGEHMGVGINQAGENVLTGCINGVAGRLLSIVGDNFTIVHCHWPHLVYFIGWVNHMAIYNQ